jgi:hypothetical protein
MFCRGFCFSIYRHFVPSFVYHSVYGLVLLLLSKSNSSDIISYCYTYLFAFKEIKNITVVDSFYE